MTTQTPLPSRLRSDAGRTLAATSAEGGATRKLAPPAGQGPTTCSCNPRHLEVGGYDPGCPVHDPEGARV